MYKLKKKMEQKRIKPVENSMLLTKLGNLYSSNQ